MSKFSRQAAQWFESLFDVQLARRGSTATLSESRFQRIFLEGLAVDCVFDVGANVGQFALSLRHDTCFKGLILSFEPNPDAFAILLREAASDPLWHCYPFALGSFDGVQPLNITRDSVFASFSKPVIAEKAHFAEQNTVLKHIDISVRRLDGLFDKLQNEHEFSKPMLKLDTQGYDLEVLRGTSDCCKAFVAAVSEVSFSQLYEDQPTLSESLAAFRSAGFVPVDLFNVHPSATLSEIIECNCYFVRA